MTAVSKSQAKTDIAASFPDNIVGTITPTGARTMFNEMVDSWVDTLLPGASTGSLVFWADASSPTALPLGSRASIIAAGSTAPSWITGVAGQALQIASGSVAWTNAISITAPAGNIAFQATASTSDGVFLQLSGANFNVQLGENGTGGVLKIANATGQLDFGTSNTVQFSISNNGAMFAAGQSVGSVGTINASGVFDNSRRVFNTATSPLALSGSGVGSISGGSGTALAGLGSSAAFTSVIPLGLPGTAVGQISLAGNTSPSNVTLAANASGASWTFRFPASGGTNQYLMSTDGSGNASWVTGAQIPGTATNDSASAGNIGEFTSSTVLSGSAVTLSSNNPSNVTSISLAAGDYDAWGVVGIANPGGAGTMTNYIAWISPTSATLPTAPNSGAYFQLLVAFTAGNPPTFPVGQARVSLSTTTTLFLSTQQTFAGGTFTAYGFLAARRRR